MKASSHQVRFLKSTRGQIVQLLREKSLTVNELAEKLSLTDNAIRVHLTTLERDGLVRQSGERPGLRKPHFTYELTPQAEELFPKAYAPILNAVVGKLESNLGSEKSAEFLRQVGRDMAVPYCHPQASFDEKIKTVLQVIEGLGGQAQVERKGNKVTIRSNGCVLASVVAQHCSACNILAEFIAQIVGCDVADQCRRGECPQCCFEITIPAVK